MIARVAPWWALIGFSLLLCVSIVRLTPKALAGLTEPTLFTLLVYGVSVAIMLYAEGYRGFQQRFSPRFAQRALAIRHAPTAARVLFAPFYAMALFDAPRRRMIASWVLLFMIIVLVALVAQLEQPWRGAVDAGVVAGLTYGLLATIGCFFSARRHLAHLAEVDAPLEAVTSSK
ncbi:MAG: hypothetical protein AAFV53_30900 [Myxococcota bacterium]